jgi:hypothetical protein
VKIAHYAAHKARLQKKILDAQPAFEAETSGIEDPNQLAERLNAYTARWIGEEEW